MAAMDRIRQLVSAGYYCSIEKKHHPYGEQPIRRTVASLNAACEAMSVLDEDNRRSAKSHMVTVAEQYLRGYQCEECAQRSVWGDVNVPKVLYKYIRRGIIGNGAPKSLRATQLLALNDDMECNVITMKDVNQSMLDMLRMVREKAREHLRVDIPWEDLLKEPLHYGSPRLSPYIQRYLNPLVGVVSFSTDIWRAHNVGPLRSEHRYSRGLRYGNPGDAWFRVTTRNLFGNCPNLSTSVWQGN